MKPIVKHYIALALLLLLQTSLLAQQYPVQANLNVITPCPNKLSSFFPLSGSRLSLSLLLTDFAQPEVQVRLHVKIEGAGLTIQSQTNLSLPVFTLQGGVPLTLGQQVEPYFRTANLLASGNGATQFMQNGVLPEGFFTITITVLEHRRNVQISNPARSFAWIIVNDPPLLVTPGNNQTIEPGGIQNIFISWIPRHVVTPTSGSQITYNLSLWEVPQGFDPQMVVNTLQPIETVSTLSSNVIWGPDKTALTPGKRYVVAVKAIDPNNEVTFKNNGVSAAHSFVYGQPCLTPINLSHSNVYFQTADVAWYPLGSAQNFRVEFKAASEPNDAWRNLDVAQTSTTITNLSPNTQYNYRVSAVCGNFVSSPTANRNFTTLTIPPLDNECTSDISVPQTDETPLLTSLPFGQLFMAAGFPVEAGQTIQVAPNTFDGSGIITLPLFNFGIRANLKGVKVNHSLQMVAGTVEAVYGDSLVLLGGTDDTPSGPGSVDFSNPNDTVFLEAPIDSVYMNDDGTWTVVDTNGDTTVISPGEGGTLVVGSDGNGVVIIDGVAYPVTVDTNGSGSGSGDGSGSGSTINPTSLCSQTVTFAPGGSMHKYGFDPYKEALPPGTYNTINAGGQTLHLPWKSVATGGSDRLLATPKTDSTLTFAYQGGMPLTGISTQDGRHVWTLNPPGGEDNLLALCQADSSGNASVAGGVRVKTYDLKRHRVAVVPVGTSQPAFTRQELQTALNAIYAQAVTEWEVTLEQPLDATGLTTTLEVNTTDYSNDMRAMMRAYVMQRNRVPGTTYLFIIPGFADNSSMVGYMPLKSGYGFLTPTATTRDAAHELGHGVFNLRHTFSSNNVITLPEGSTQNLMDYSQGTELFKYQWDFIHNPEGGWFLWEDSEEGAMIASSDSIKIEIESFKTEFAPGVGNLELKYNLSESSKQIVEKYPNEDFKIHFAIADKKNDIVYKLTEDANKEGTFIWNGYMNDNKSDSITYENGPYKLATTVTLGNVGINKWQDIKDFAYELIFSDSVRVISHSIDTSFNILNDPIKLDWLANIETYSTNTYIKTPEEYSNFIKNGKTKGVFPSEDFELLKWLNEHEVKTTSVKFLNATVKDVIKEFGMVIHAADSILKTDNPTLYSSIKSKYSGTHSGLFVRYIGGTTSPSNHSTGAAVDFRVKYNPMYRSTDNERVGFVKYITGVDLLAAKQSNDALYNASKAFLQKFYGNNPGTTQEVIDKYTLIHAYNIDGIIGFSDLEKVSTDTLIVNNLQSGKQRLINVLTAHKSSMVFNQNSKTAIDSLIAHLNRCASDTLPKYVSSQVNSFFTERKAFYTMVTNIGFSDLQAFYDFFSKEDTRFNDNLLLEDGFCDIEVEVYEAFDKAHRMVTKKLIGIEYGVEWGGIYDTMIDAMHFCMPKEVVLELMKK